MVWIIVGAVIVLAVGLWGRTSMKVPRNRAELQSTIHGVIPSTSA